MAESIENPTGESGERTIVRDMSFLGASWGANAAMVDVKDGKIIRIRPARYYDQYIKEEVKPWVMRARGNRGTSKFERISWDEALDIITSEMLRVKEEYGPTAILYQNDQHGENKIVHGPHGCGRKLLRLFGGYTHQVRNADSWEGWYWGAKHVWGCEHIGQQKPQKNLLWDIAKNAELLLFWGCDQETTTWGWGGQLCSRLSYWWTELGIKQVYIAPDLNYAAAVHADRWLPILPNTDAALYLAIAYRWFQRGTYDKAYLETHAYGVDKFEPRVGGPDHRRARAHHQSLGRRMGFQANHRRHRQRRSGHPRPVFHRARPSAGTLPGHAGPRQARR